MPISLAKLLRSVPDDTETRVRKTRDTNRELIRDALKSECRLQFRTEQDSGKKDSAVQVPVELHPGLPTALENVIFPDNHELALLLSRYRSALEQSSDGLENILRLIEELNQRPEWKLLVEKGGPGAVETHQLVLMLLKRLIIEDPLITILGVDEDTLGIYRFSPLDEDLGSSVAKIELYWGVIGLVAQWLPASVEDVTIVTLTHELAHAYTHLGADINGQRWAGAAFDDTERSVLEGLAQYYTQRALKRLERKLPTALTVFNTMLKKQSKVYHVHTEWEKMITTPEAVRRALIEFRVHQETELVIFQKRLKQAEKDFTTNDKTQLTES